MKLVAYLADTEGTPDTEDSVRVEEEISDEDYIAKGKEYYEEQLKQRLISEYGKGESKEGRRWEWSSQLKSRIKTEVTVEPRIVEPKIRLVGRPTREEVQKELKRLSKETEEKFVWNEGLYQQYIRDEITLKKFYEGVKV